MPLISLCFDKQSKESTQKLLTEFDGMQITGIDSDTPFVRIGNCLFEGKYDQSIGTDLIFNNSTRTSTQLAQFNTSNLKLILTKVKFIEKI